MSGGWGEGEGGGGGFGGMSSMRNSYIGWHVMLEDMLGDIPL